MYAGIWPLSSLVFSDEDFELLSVTPMEKELCNLASVSIPVAWEISGTSIR